ncbi:hypothetical protein MCOL2_18794, partial [Listeria fleischmannii FSL S10-1203]
FIYEEKFFGLLDSRLCFIYNKYPFKVIFAHAKIRRDRLPLAVFFLLFIQVKKIHDTALPVFSFIKCSHKRKGYDGMLEKQLNLHKGEPKNEKIFICFTSTAYPVN